MSSFICVHVHLCVHVCVLLYLSCCSESNILKSRFEPEGLGDKISPQGGSTPHRGSTIANRIAHKSRLRTSTCSCVRACAAAIVFFHWHCPIMHRNNARHWRVLRRPTSCSVTWYYTTLQIGSRRWIRLWYCCIDGEWFPSWREWDYDTRRGCWWFRQLPLDLLHFHCAENDPRLWQLPDCHPDLEEGA